MNEIKKLNPVSLLGTLEANPESDAWIKQREKELAEQASKEAAYQTQKNIERSGVPRAIGIQVLIHTFLEMKKIQKIWKRLRILQILKRMTKFLFCLAQKDLEKHILVLQLFVIAAVSSYLLKNLSSNMNPPRIFTQRLIVKN